MNHENIQTGKGHTEQVKQATIPHLRLQQQGFHRCLILSGSEADSSSSLQCLSIPTLVSPFGDQQEWHKRPYRKKIMTHCFHAWEGESLNKQQTETMYSRVNQHMLTAFPRVTRSQWLQEDICCINLQYLKKALLSLRCIYTLIGFFLASK